MTEFILTIVGMAALCFMATCLLIVFAESRRKEEAAEKERTAEEQQELEKLIEQQKKTQEIWDDMMAWTGGTVNKESDNW